MKHVKSAEELCLCLCCVVVRDKSKVMKIDRLIERESKRVSWNLEGEVGF